MRKILIWLPIVVILELTMEAWRLWGWRAGELSFHESWSPELCAELQELDACLLAEPMRELVIDEISEDGDIDDGYDSTTDDEEISETEDEEDDDEEISETEDEEDDDEEISETEDEEDDDEDEIDVFEDTHADEEYEVNYNRDYLKNVEIDLRGRSSFPWLYLRKSIELRDYLTHARRNLKQTATKGYQAKDQRHTTAAHLAAHFGKAALLRELVKRGTAPNAWDETMMETVFHAAIVGLPYADHAPLPVQEKLELLDFLLSHYSFFTEEAVNDALEAAIDAMSNDKDDKGQTLEWLITHDFDPQSLSVWHRLMSDHKSREIIQRLVNQGKLKIEPFDVSCMLEGALECAAWGGEVKDTLLWLLDDLHADLSDPLFHEPMKQRSFISRYVSQLFDHAEFKYSYNRDVARHLDYIEILLNHGARLSPKEINALRPKNKKLRARFEAIIQAHQP